MINAFEIGLNVDEATALHDQLRALGPAIQTTDAEGLPVWVVTRHADVAQLLVDPTIVNKKPGGPEGSPGLQLPPALANNLLNMWPEDHRRVRALAALAFSRRRIGPMRTMVEQNVGQLLDAAAGGIDGTVDLMTALTSPLPARVISDILGVDPEPAAQFRAAAADIMSIDPSDPASNDVRIPAMTTIVMVLASVIAAKRAAPGDDVISDWIRAREAEEGEQLTEDELLGLAFLVFLAGFENSVYQIANAIGILLAEDRATVLADIADDGRWRKRVAQLVFDAAPGSFAIRRFNTEPLMIGDMTIPAGSPLYLSLRAAMTDPDRTAIDLSFGRGPHYCLGADLAVMQLDLATRAVFQRWPAMTLAQPWETLKMRRSWRTHGPVTLPVKLG